MIVPYPSPYMMASDLLLPLPLPPSSPPTRPPATLIPTHPSHPQETTPLLTPQILICSVGSEIFYLTPEGRLVQDRAWEAALDAGWDRGAVQAIAAGLPQLKPQVRRGEGDVVCCIYRRNVCVILPMSDACLTLTGVFCPCDLFASVPLLHQPPHPLPLQPSAPLLQVATEQRRHKLSFHLTRGATPADDEAVIQTLRDQLSAAGLTAKVVYSGGVDVDVLAAGAGKGAALAFLLQQLAARGATPPGGVQVGHMGCTHGRVGGWGGVCCAGFEGGGGWGCGR
jgi:hypothetical protein